MKLKKVKRTEKASQMGKELLKCNGYLKYVRNSI